MDHAVSLGENAKRKYAANRKLLQDPQFVRDLRLVGLPGLDSSKGKEVLAHEPNQGTLDFGKSQNPLTGKQLLALHIRQLYLFPIRL